MRFKIFLAVIIGKFFAWLDRALGHDESVAGPSFDFAIWPAGMIDIARAVGSSPAVDHFLIANREKIFAFIGVRFRFGEHASGIFDDAAAFFYRAKRKKAEAGTRALHHEFMLANRKFSFGHVGPLVEKSQACKCIIASKRNNYLCMKSQI
jgi:hypothetical protein